MSQKPTVTEITRALEEAARVAVKGSRTERAGQFALLPEEPASHEGATDDALVLYESGQGVRVQLRYGGDTMWATQKQMADLFAVGVSAISKHLRNALEEGELDLDSVMSNQEITAADGKRYPVAVYNLDAIISVGYRVSSKQGTMFRRWATDKLVQYATKGFALDDERLKEPGGNDYFSELRERIRDIRASESNLYAELRSICALCSDYDPKSQAARNFYTAMQNKLLWATVTGTAPEIIVHRADATKENMGLTAWRGRDVVKADVTIAKNYLGQLEISDLNRLTSMVLDYFEDQTERRRVVTMGDLEQKLGEFLKFNSRAILAGKGTISREDADRHAETEYKKFSEARRLKRQSEGQATVAKLVKLEKEARLKSKHNQRRKP